MARASVLEIVERAQPAFRRHASEEAGRRLVRSDAGGHQQADHAFRFRQRQGALDEQAVEVHVAAGEQRVIAAGPRHAGPVRRPGAGPREIAGERIPGPFQRGDQAPAVGGARGVRDLGPAGREPFDLLQLHPVPGRVADHGVEAALGRVALPLRPDAGEGDLPVQEALLGGERPRLGEEAGEALSLSPARGRCAFVAHDGDGVAEAAREEGLERRPVLGRPQAEPVEGVDQGENPVERRGHRLDLGEGFGGAVRLGDFRVRERLDGRHAPRRAGGAGDRIVQQKRRSVFRRLVDAGAHPGAEQAVAAAQMVVEEGERRADGEGMQPERDLGELHRHRVLVHAVDAALEHHAPHDVAVVEAFGSDGPAVRLGVGADGGAGGLDAVGERRTVVAPIDRRLRFGHGGDGPVGEPVHQIDQEMPGAHGRVADLERQQAFGRVERAQFGEATRRVAPVPEFLGAGAERRHGRGGERPQSLVEDQADQIVRRVVAAGVLAREDVGADGDAPALRRERALQQAFVDGAQLADAEIAVVDVLAAPVRRPFEGERVDDVGHDRIAQPDAAEQRRAGAVEQAAVVGRQADGGVAGVDGAAEIVDGRPVTGGALGEDVALVLAPPDVAAHLRAQGVIVVARVADGQQVAVLGVEDEEEAVEQDERGLAHLRQRRVRRGGGDGAGELREDPLEDLGGEIAGDALLVEAAFVDGVAVETRRPFRAGQEGRAPEDQREDLQPVAAGFRRRGEQVAAGRRGGEERRQVDLEELLGDGARALPVEPPAGAVGEDAPAQPALRQVLHPAQVAEHLGRRRGLLAVHAGAAVERAPPALGFDQRRAQRVAPPLLRQGVGAVFRGCIGEEQAVRHVVAPAGAQVLLPQALRPAEALEDGPDQVVLGLAFVGGAFAGEAGEERAEVAFEGVERRVVERLPIRRAGDRVAQEAVGEQAAAGKVLHTRSGGRSPFHSPGARRAEVFFARPRGAHPGKRGPPAGGAHASVSAGGGAGFNPWRMADAARTAATIRASSPQRHGLPRSARRTSAALGSMFSSRKSTMFVRMPPVQSPHRAAR